jgi:hypothetical protein
MTNAQRPTNRVAAAENLESMGQPFAAKKAGK